MTDEAKQNQDAQKPEAGNEAKNAPKGKKGGLIKYIIFGVVGLVAVLGIAFGTMMFLSGSDTTEGTTEKQVEAAVKTETHGEEAEDISGNNTHAADFNESDEDSILAFLEQDEAVLDELMAALEVLDYNPENDVTMDDATGMTIEDSLAESKWLDEEKARLAQRESELEAREKRLNVLEARIQQKILRIEQAESTRIGKLAKLYDGMDPKSVARLVANLDDATVVSLLPRMKLKNASSTLALMPPVRAARLSKQMITIAEN